MSAFEPWVRDFLLAGTRTGALATVRADSSPHVKPVWFTLDGDVLVFNTHRDSVAGKALLRDQRVAIAVDEPVPPFSFVLLRGRVEISTDPRSCGCGRGASAGATWESSGRRSSPRATGCLASCSCGSPRSASWPPVTSPSDRWPPLAPGVEGRRR